MVVFPLWRIILAWLRADEEVELIPHMLVFPVYIHIVVAAVLAYLAGLLAEALVEEDTHTVVVHVKVLKKCPAAAGL